MNTLNTIVSCLALLISLASFYVSYRVYLLDRKQANVDIYHLVEHYEKFSRHYRWDGIYFQTDLFFDICPIKNNATALTGDKRWILDSGERFDGYFRKYVSEIGSLEAEIRAVTFTSRNKQLKYLCDFSLLYLQYIEGLYCQYKRVIDQKLHEEQAIKNAHSSGLQETQHQLELMHQKNIEKKYLKRLKLR